MPHSISVIELIPKDIGDPPRFVHILLNLYIWICIYLDYGNAVDVFTIVIVNIASHIYPAYRGRLQMNMVFFDAYQANMQSADWFGNILLLILTPKEFLS